jgi:hypothetical protein
MRWYMCISHRNEKGSFIPHFGDGTLNSSELLTLTQLAHRLSLRPRTVQIWVRHGRIPVLRITPKVLRFEWDQVLEALRNNTSKEVQR